MVIDKENWMGKLFFWALGICEAFTEKDLIERFSKKTSKCHFLRVLVVYLPLILLAQLLFWTYAGLLLFAVPIYGFGFVGFLKATGAVLGGIVAVVVILVAWGGCMEIKERICEKNMQKSTATFWMLVVEWLKEKKEGICGEVIFIGGGKDA